MNNVVGFAFFVFLTFLLTVDCLVWKSCDDSGRGKVTSVKITGCDQTAICALKKGQNASFEVDFAINEDTKTAKSVVHGVISGVPVPFPLDNPDACKDSGISCPLKKGQQYNYSTYIFVKTEYPSIKLVVKWELQDDNSKDIFCIQVPVEIVSGNKLFRIL